MRKVFAIFLLIATFYGCAQQDSVFVLASYDEDDVCGRPQVEGIVDAIKKDSSHIKLKVFYLDSRRTKPDELDRKCENFIKELKNPKLVFTGDDAAFQCAAKYLMGKNISVVFSGINITPDKYNEKYNFLQNTTPLKNFTGLYERLHIEKQMELLESLIGKINKVAVLYSTDLIGEALKNQVLYETKNTVYKDRFILFPVSNKKELLDAIDKISKNKEIDAYFPFVMSIEEDGKKLILKDVAPVLQEKIKKIDIAINKDFVNLGFFGGISLDFYQMGYRAGEIGLSILKGKAVSDFDVEDAEKTVKILNLKRAEKIGIKLGSRQLSLFDEVIK